MAIDMFHRLHNSSVIEVLLLHQLFLTALNEYCNGAPLEFFSMANRFLEAAHSTNNPVLFCAIARFFRNRPDINQQCLRFFDIYERYVETPDASFS